MDGERGEAARVFDEWGEEVRGGERQEGGRGPAGYGGVRRVRRRWRLGGAVGVGGVDGEADIVSEEDAGGGLERVKGVGVGDGGEV